jgi:hypothetical protein
MPSSFGSARSAAAALLGPQQCRRQQLGHRQRVAQRQAVDVIRVHVVVDDVVGRRPCRHERQAGRLQGRQFLDHDRAETPAEHRHQVGHPGEFLDVADAARRDRAVVLDHELQRPPVQHAAGRIDFLDRRAHAEFHRLRRRAVVEAELAVDAEQDRLSARGRCGGLPQPAGQQRAGKDAAHPAQGARHGEVGHDDPVICRQLVILAASCRYGTCTRDSATHRCVACLQLFVSAGMKRS